MTAAERRPLHPAAAAGAVLFLVGIAAAVWLGDWRWAVTGLILLLVGGVVAGTRLS